MRRPPQPATAATVARPRWRARAAAALWVLGALAAPAHASTAPATPDPSANGADLQLNNALPVAVAPLVMPSAPAGTVVPSQVLRWRQEATAFEHGENGSPRDPARAATLYCLASRHGDAESQFALAWMLANGRGVERDDRVAAHLFAAAAEQGFAQAQNLPAQLRNPLGEPPLCLRPPEADRPVAAVAPPRAVGPATTTAARTAAAGRAAPGAIAYLPGGLRPITAHPLYTTAAPKPIAEFVRLVAPDYQVPPQLVLAVMAAESNFNANAVSPKQAQGLMQLIPETASRFKVRNLMDPAQNIRGGMAYLRWLLAFFEGDVPLAVAAYNAGERAVERYRGVPPYAETQHYVRKVMALFDEPSRVPFDARAAEPSPALAMIRLARR